MNALPVLLASGIETTINRVLGLDPETKQKFFQLAGKVIAIELRDLNLRFFILPAQDQIHVQGRFEGSADTTLRGTSIAMARMSLRDSAADSLFAGDVEVIGDVELGEQFRAVLDGLDIDWEEQLSKVTGDIIAHQVGNAVRHVSQWGRKTADILRQDVSEYLHEESRVLPDAHEVETFNKAVDAIRLDVERLEARVNRLQQHFNLAEKSKGNE